MRVLLSDWRGHRMPAFNWLSWRFEFGRWHYNIDRWGCVIVDWVWEKDEQAVEHL